MPVVIIRPILKRLLAPAPKAVTNGSTPRTVAKVVINIGSQAHCRCLQYGLLSIFTFGHQVIGKIDNENAVFTNQGRIRVSNPIWV